MARRLPLLFAFLMTLTFVQQAEAQCTPDPSYTTAGYYPTEGLDTVYFGQAYDATITLVIPSDSSLGPLTSTIDSIVINSITGIPDGLVESCNPVNCVFPGGASSCIALTGTVTDMQFIGSNPIVANGTIYGSLLPGLPVEISDFTIEVADTTSNTSVNEVSGIQFDLKQNSPNPFHDVTNIEFVSPQNQPYSLKITNMLGLKIFEQSGVSEGRNEVSFRSGDLPEGFYFYTVNTGEQAQTRRMIITR